MGKRVAVAHVVVIVDVANVGLRPDGWWKDRAAAATTLLNQMRALTGRQTTTPDGREVILDQIVAVVEGQARTILAPDEITVIRAPQDGDTTIVEAAREFVGRRARVLVITADRGLRTRLPAEVTSIGPEWWNTHLGR